jgi:hypothetical protein
MECCRLPVEGEDIPEFGADEKNERKRSTKSCLVVCDPQDGFREDEWCLAGYKCKRPGEDEREARELGYETKEEVETVVKIKDQEREQSEIIAAQSAEEVIRTRREESAAEEEVSVAETAEEKEEAGADLEKAEEREQEARDKSAKDAETAKENSDLYAELMSDIETSKIQLCPNWEVKHSTDPGKPTWTDTEGVVYGQMPTGLDSDNAGYFSDGDDKWNMHSKITPTSDELGGRTYELGNNIIVVTSVDDHGNTNECKMNVWVIDDEPPVINCPNDMDFSTSRGRCSRLIEWPEPRATDNVDGVRASATHASPYSFGPGKEVIVFTATDSSGNEVVCSFTVTITDREPPQMRCPVDETHVFPSPSCAEDPSLKYDCEVRDNCGDLTSADIVFDPKLPHPFPLGSTTITQTLTDRSGNSVSSTTVITLEDETAPEINCPPDRTEEIPTDSPTLTIDPLIAANATDNSCHWTLECTTPNPGTCLCVCV